MDYLDAVVLGVVEGLTEFLPVSSTGHLTIAEKLLGLDVDDPAVTGYTAVIQMGAIAAVIVYFARDIWNIIRAWTLGLVKSEYRGQLDHRMGWYVIVATIPVGVVGLLAKDLITGDLRSLWVVAVALIAWSARDVAGRAGGHARTGPSATWACADAITIGLAQAVALIPGISRSGATISVGLFRGLDRVTATKLSFFMSIPALLAAGVYQLKDAFSGDIGAGQAIVGIVVAFVVAYASIAWLLRFVAHHSIAWFVPYRVGLGVLLLVAAASSRATSCQPTLRPAVRDYSQPDFLNSTQRPPDDRDHQDHREAGSRAPAAARACGRSSCRRRRRSASARPTSATPAEIFRMSSFCWTVIRARCASNAVDSSESRLSMTSAAWLRWSSTSRKNGPASGSTRSTSPSANLRIGSRRGSTARRTSAISRLST